MSMEDEADRQTIVASNKSRKEGTKVVQTAVPDPPQGGVVRPASESCKQRLTWNTSTMARRATRRASVGRSTPIQTNPDLDLVKQNMKIGNAHTTPKGRKDPKSEKDHLNDEGHG